MTPLLRLDGVSKSFGALKVTDAVSLELAAGEALGILGPNGAGKSTLFNLITGGLKPDEGRIEFDGRDITRLAPHARSRLGIGRSHQIPQPFAGMSVYENLLVGAVFGGRQSERQAQSHCLDVLATTGLIDKANRAAGALTLLERKRLELARALALKPKLLLLDEIAGGLTEAECQALVGTIRAIRAAGVSLIWIEHVVHALLSAIDRLFVINFGQALAEGAPAAVLADPRVQSVYMGIDEAAA
ncbi:ABC transporter ATP-binding protein [Desertibaculum subflavum]|uniref:ABC transporter ATP-binding protein n=1 Tax=Desertibaculum subflavum TaxID=2268458 RepID=UPI000E6740DA